MDQPAAIRRRWFRFNLRMLFVLVTIAGVYAGWAAYQLKWIRERHEFTADGSGVLVFAYLSPTTIQAAPWQLRLFGEQGIWKLVVMPSQFDRAKSLFPEAQIQQFVKGDFRLPIRD